MKSLYTLLALLTISSYTFAQEWNVNEFGPGPDLASYDLTIGDGRNDSTERVYVTTKAGDLYEWTYDSTSKTWNHTTVAKNLRALVTIDMGQARNDGKNRLYLTEFINTGRVLEAEWTGTSWKINKMDDNLHSLTIVVGDGRNDGKNYVYVGSTNGGTLEYAWDGTNWVKTQIHFQASEGVGIVGDSKNDQVNRLLMTSDNVKEYTWQGTRYTIDSPSPKIEWPDAIHIGQGRNDGINRIYANCFSGRGRIEYTWNGTFWTETIINPFVHRGDIYTAAVKADGLTRVYTTTSKYFKGEAGTLNEFVWNSNTKQFDSTVVLDATSGATAMIVSGYGRNDDTMRLYATNYVAGTTYELTNKSPFVKNLVGLGNIQLHPITFSVYPNPSQGSTHFNIDNPDQIEWQLDLVDHMGKRIKTLPTSRRSHISGTLDLSSLSDGIYYLRISEGNRFVVRQIVLTK